ncbi:MAG TPA: DsbA family protein, partial [Anaerolineales bacterium]
AVLGFFAGMLLSYLIWGRAEITTIPVSQLSSTASGTPTPETSGQASDLAAQLENLPRHNVPVDSNDPVLGPSDAPITIIEFADFECPYCQRYALETHPRLIEEYGAQVRFVYKDFPLTSIHAEAFPAALAGQCALEQNEFWEYHDLLFSGRLGLSRNTYLAYAGELGLDVDEFEACFDEGRYADAVQADYDFAVGLGVSSTPTFLINGIAVVGAQPFSVFSQIIEYELAHLRN